jgi:P-type Cu+ transporter
LLSENGVTFPQEAESFLVNLEEKAKTGILVAYDGVFVGLLGITDPLKREAAVVIEGLKKMGIKPVMLTGDNWRTALAVAKEVSLVFLSVPVALRECLFTMTTGVMEIRQYILTGTTFGKH